MKKSLESSVELLFIKLLRSDSRLSGKSIVHFDQESKAKSAEVIVRATQGERNLSAFGGHDVEVVVEYRAPAKTPATVNSIISAAIRESIESPSLAQSVLVNMRNKSGLIDILIRDETAGDRQNATDLRKRSFTFPVQARMA